MKVDKAVCTDKMTEAESAISYENVLSTLVQKKMLAIKRECEAKKVEKQRRKQQNCLGSLIFGKRHDSTDKCDDSGRTMEAPNDAELNSINPSISQQVTVPDSKHDVLKCDDNRDTIARSILVDKGEHMAHIESMDVQINYTHVNEMTEKVEIIGMESSKCQMLTLNECKTGKNDNNSTQTSDESRNDDINKRSINVRNGTQANENKSEQSVTRINLVENVQYTAVKSDSSTIELDIESSNTATNSKSPSIVSQIEVSDEINAKQKMRTRKSSSDTISVTSLINRTTSSAPADTIVVHDQEQRHQVRVFEAKSISAQCSPIFAQRQIFNVAAIENTNKSPLPQRLFSTQNTSDDSANVTFVNSPPKKRDAINEATKDDTAETDERSSYSQAQKSKRSGKTFFKKKDKVPKRSIANNEAHGFISSFNQLTSNNLPVITSATTTMLKNVTSKKCDRSSGGGGGDGDNQGINDDSNELSVEQILNKKAAKDELNKYRRTHRCSEPVLVYPSPSRLQHCILSMPPNQPIQLRYNDELMYDVSLKMETDRNNDFASDRRRHRNHKHHHHRHHHHHHHHHNGRKKRHKRKILVHDLDAQVVKVIDPEDMSQRARWTIIATACLLLLMCLLLVGVTLRMAPLIDDMVRQENERLQESMNRGKYVRNITHAAFIGGQQYQQQSQQP